MQLPAYQWPCVTDLYWNITFPEDLFLFIPLNEIHRDCVGASCENWPTIPSTPSAFTLVTYSFSPQPSVEEKLWILELCFTRMKKKTGLSRALLMEQRRNFNLISILFVFHFSSSETFYTSSLIKKYILSLSIKELKKRRFDKKQFLRCSQTDFKSSKGWLFNI